MAITFDQAFNKLQAGKNVYRPSFVNGVYLIIPPNASYIYTIFPNNVNCPAAQYCPTIQDLNATDWEVM